MTEWVLERARAADAGWLRRECMRQLRSGGEGDFGAAELICGEIIGNAIRHAVGPVRIQLRWDGDAPLLCVDEDRPAFALSIALPDDPMSENGRGLFIVDTLALDFWIEAVPGDGSRICARLPIFRV